MKPPKRSPFLHSRQQDLLQVYRHLYPDSQGNISVEDRHDALSIVQLWINRSACPFAVETTALLVQSVVLDEHMQQIAKARLSHEQASSYGPRYALEQVGGGAELGVRLNYSLALTRFVNSVVDSHQTGGFAQSIAAIAARIGLPLWFVEVRHAVTHEELPSISVCREAAGSALAWLHRQFWIPQLFEGPNALPIRPASDGQDTNGMDLDTTAAAEASTSALGDCSASQTATRERESEEDRTRRKERSKALQELRRTLKDYRDLSKKVTRDRSLVNASKNDFRRLYKQFSVFVSRIRTLEPDFGAQLIDNAKKDKDEEVDVRGAAVMDPDDVDECTKSALSDLVNQLIQPGGMIPLGASKRVPATAVDDDVVLPAELVSIWGPLLGHLRNTYGSIFGQLLTEELVDAVIREVDSGPGAETPQIQMTSTSAEDAAEGADPSSQSWKRSAYASPSYRKTADAWIRYLVTTAPPPSPVTGAANSSTSRPPTTLIADTEVAQMCLAFRTSSSVSILDFLCQRNDQLKTKFEPLVAVLRVAGFVSAAAVGEDLSDDDVEMARERDEDVSGFERQLEAMQERLRDMDALPRPEVSSEEVVEDAQTAEVVQAETAVEEEGSAAVVEVDHGQMPTGWSMAGADWRPTPFGCLDGRIPNLVV
ncbi:Protein LAS1 [Pseudozyma hubeiensis]|nr:Protein LAS1 [Pseudozyma hubeiensis]